MGNGASTITPPFVALDETKVASAVTSTKATPSARPELVLASKLLEESAGCDGLAFAIQELAKQPTHPEAGDLDKFLVEAMRSYRSRAAVRAYHEPILPGLQMKCDEFDGIHALKTERVHAAVWNFRRAAELPIFGTGQCHLEGLAFIARKLKTDGFERILWFNMREEPVVYLNGTASAPRVAGKLNENIDYLLSIQGYELDSIEARLVDDCAAASTAAASDGGLQVWFETAGVSTQQAVDVKPFTGESGGSFSVRGAFEWLNEQEGVAPVSYHRVPIADETAPEEQDFDQLVTALKEFSAMHGGVSTKDTALVFNCHMGRGRTTTGMVCAAILTHVARGWTPPASAAETPLPEPSADNRDLKRGEFSAILKMLKQLDAFAPHVAAPGLGARAKLLVDSCADACAEVTHLVDAPAKCLEKGEAAKAKAGGDGEGEAPKAAAGPAEAQNADAAFWSHRALKYLERYAYLLLFAAYAQLAVEGGFTPSFSTWTRKHWAFKRTIKELDLD